METQNYVLETGSISPEDAEYMVSITTRNPNPQLSHRKKIFILPAEFDWFNPETGKMEWLHFLSPQGEKSKIEVPAILDKRNHIDAHNIEMVRRYKETGKQHSEDIFVVDPAKDAVDKAIDTSRVIEVQYSLTQLYRNKGHDTLASIYRRVSLSTTRGMTAEQVYNMLIEKAESDPDGIMRWMGEDVDPMFFLLDQACEKGGPLVRQGDEYFLVDSPDVLIASSTRAMIKYMRDRPQFVSAVRHKLERAGIDPVDVDIERLRQRPQPQPIDLGPVASAGDTDSESGQDDEDEQDRILRSLQRQSAVPNGVESLLDTAIACGVVRKVNATTFRLPNGSPKGIVKSREDLVNLLSNPKNGPLLTQLRMDVEASETVE